MLTITVALVTHLIDIAYWAILFVFCREFSESGPAYYHSATNYTTLGYGDLIMTSSWRMLRPVAIKNTERG